MMMTLLVLKSRMKTFYEKHYTVIRILWKSVVVFLALLLITRHFGYSSVLSQWGVLILGAFVCGFMPDVTSAGVLFFSYFWEILQASPVLGMVLLITVMIYFLVLGRVVHGQEYMILLVPILSYLNMQFAVPLVAALFVSPLMLPAVAMGTLFQHLLDAMVEYINISASSADVASTGSTDRMWTPMQYLIDYLGRDTMLFVSVGASLVTFLVVYMIRRSQIRRSSQIAILAGGLVCLMILMFANIGVDLGLDPFFCTLNILLGMLVAYVVQFFRMTLDYHGTRKLQFEDDEYYYYVTAIPKYKVAVVDKTVTRIVPDAPEEVVTDLKEELEKTLDEENEESGKDEKRGSV